MAQKHGIASVVLYLVLVLLIWTGISLLLGSHQEVLSGSGGEYDLRGDDFENTAYVIDASWESWPDELYTPQELLNAGESLSSQDIDYTTTHYATHVLTLKLKPHVAYGISFYSSNYAMRMFIDGVEVMSVGDPGTTRAETEPRVRKVAYYFTPQNETTQIVVQASNFVHRQGGQPPELTIGTQQNIVGMERESDMRSGLILGCIIAAFLYHLGIFLLNRNQRASLLFALLCLLLAYQSSEPILFLFPAYDWSLATRVEYLVNLSALIVLILLTRRLFPEALSVWVYRVYVSLCVLYGGVVLCTDSTVYTQGLPAFQATSIVLTLYILVRLAMTLREKNLKNILAFLGVLLVGMCGIGDVLYRNGLFPLGLVDRQTLTIGTGVTLFVFCYVLVLAIEQAEVNKRFEDMHLALAESEARYTTLMEAKRGDKTLAERLAELGLTKREREVASLLLSGKSREEIAALLNVSLGTVNTHCTNIYRKVGCGNVGELAHLVNPGWFL